MASMMRNEVETALIELIEDGEVFDIPNSGVQLSSTWDMQAEVLRTRKRARLGNERFVREVLEASVKREMTRLKRSIEYENDRIALNASDKWNPFL